MSGGAGGTARARRDAPPRSPDPDLRRLAALLAVDIADLPPGIAKLPAARRAALVDHVSDRLHRRDASRLAALANVVDRLPAQVAAKVAQERMEPAFVARLAAHLPAGAAEGVIVRLAPGYLAEVAAFAELPRCAPLLAAIPAGIVAETARILAATRRWIEMAAIAEHLPDLSLRAALEALDDEAIADTVALGRAESAERVLGLLPRDRAAALAPRLTAVA